MIFSGFEYRLNLFLIGGSTATHILGQQLAAVEPNADSVIASQEERLSAHLARSQNAVQISGSKVVRQSLHHAILPTGFEDPRLPIVAEHSVSLKLLLRPELSLEGHLAVGFHEGTHASPGSQLKDSRQFGAGEPRGLPGGLGRVPVRAFLVQLLGVAGFQGAGRFLERF